MDPGPYPIVVGMPVCRDRPKLLSLLPSGWRRGGTAQMADTAALSAGAQGDSCELHDSPFWQFRSLDQSGQGIHNSLGMLR